MKAQLRPATILAREEDASSRAVRYQEMPKVSYRFEIGIVSSRPVCNFAILALCNLREAREHVIKSLQLAAAFGGESGSADLAGYFMRVTGIVPFHSYVMRNLARVVSPIEKLC